jgi:glycosyltransferase involved in cell wall biosynthesis
MTSARERTTSARVLSFGSLPPEWGGPRRGGVASFHRILIEAIHADPDSPLQIAGIVGTGSGEGSAPVPVRILGEGQKRPEFLAAVVAELQPDIAILNHFGTSWGLLLPRIAPGLPLVGIAHSWHQITLGEDPETAFERTQRAMNGLTAMVAPSEHCLGEGLALGLRYPADARVIRCPLPGRFAEPLALDEPRAGVVYAGGLIPRKNPAALLEAVALLPDLTLTYAGVGGERGSLGRRAAELGIESRVRFAGSLDPEQLRTAVARAEVFCVPSHSESFGIAYIEALSCGTPVVGFSSTLDEIARTSGIDVGVGLPRLTGEAVAAAIEQVRSMSWNRPLLRRAVLEGYAASDVAGEYTRLMLECLARR